MQLAKTKAPNMALACGKGRLGSAIEHAGIASGQTDNQHVKKNSERQGLYLYTQVGTSSSKTLGIRYDRPGVRTDPRLVRFRFRDG